MYSAASVITDNIGIFIQFEQQSLLNLNFIHSKRNFHSTYIFFNFSIYLKYFFKYFMIWKVKLFDALHYNQIFLINFQIDSLLNVLFSWSLLWFICSAPTYVDGGIIWSKLIIINLDEVLRRRMTCIKSDCQISQLEKPLS
jgi:hypothetical protein